MFDIQDYILYTKKKQKCYGEKFAKKNPNFNEVISH